MGSLESSLSCQKKHFRCMHLNQTQPRAGSNRPDHPRVDEYFGISIGRLDALRHFLTGADFISYCSWEDGSNLSSVIDLTFSGFYCPSAVSRAARRADWR